MPPGKVRASDFLPNPSRLFATRPQRKKKNEKKTFFFLFFILTLLVYLPRKVDLLCCVYIKKQNKVDMKTTTNLFCDFILRVKKRRRRLRKGK